MQHAGMAKIRAQVQFTEAQSELLRQIAARDGVSFSEVVRRAVDAGLRDARTASIAELRRRAVEAAGRFRSDLDDVAERHDDYLAQAYRE